MRRLLFAAHLGLALGLTSGDISAQATPPGPPAFEVASVKASNPNPSDVMSGLPRMSAAGGRLTVTNLPLRILLRMALGVQDFQIAGGRPELMSQKFDVTAKAEDGTAQTPQELIARLRPLLEDRFKLKVHTEQRDSPLYALVVSRSDGRLGPDLKVSTSDCAGRAEETRQRMEALSKEGPGALMKAMAAGIPCTMMPLLPQPGAGGGIPGMGMRGNGQPIAALVPLLTQLTGRIVADKTGLTGLYDFELRFDPEVAMRAAGQMGLNLPMPANLPPSDSPSLLTAVQEQLGLKLEAQRGPVDHVVIDNLEAPAPD